MTHESEAIQFPRSTIVHVLRDVEMLVVSSDRVGSSIAELSIEEQNRVLRAFVDDWNVFGRLSRIREILGDAFSREVGDDGMDELERELQDVPFWRDHARKPPQIR